MNEIINKDYEPVEIFDYAQYQKDMEAKIVRNPRTNTPIDYITDEKLAELEKEGITDFRPYIPIPKDIKAHLLFAVNIWIKLYKTYPNDEYLKSLDNEKNHYIVLSYDWYKKFGIEKPQL